VATESEIAASPGLSPDDLEFELTVEPLAVLRKLPVVETYCQLPTLSELVDSFRCRVFVFDGTETGLVCVIFSRSTASIMVDVEDEEDCWLRLPLQLPPPSPIQIPPVRLARSSEAQAGFISWLLLLMELQDEFKLWLEPWEYIISSPPSSSDPSD